MSLKLIPFLGKSSITLIFSLRSILQILPINCQITIFNKESAFCQLTLFNIPVKIHFQHTVRLLKQYKSKLLKNIQHQLDVKGGKLHPGGLYQYLPCIVKGAPLTQLWHLLVHCLVHTCKCVSVMLLAIHIGAVGSVHSVFTDVAKCRPINILGQKYPCVLALLYAALVWHQKQSVCTEFMSMGYLADVDVNVAADIRLYDPLQKLFGSYYNCVYLGTLCNNKFE